jgi:DNA-binding winged helix-turn-helix (wHTH) protein
MPTLFGAFVLDRETRQLRKGLAPQRLLPRAFELLELLVERRPAAVSKQEIRDRLWPDSIVSARWRRRCDGPSAATGPGT